MNYVGYRWIKDADAADFAVNIKKYYGIEGDDVYDKYCEGISKIICVVIVQILL